MLACTDKSKLIHDLEKLPSTVDTIKYTEVTTSNEQNDPIPTSPKIAIIDGMVLVQKMARNKKGTFGTVKDLAQGFNDRLTTLTAGFSEVILAFDTYKPESLKQKTRERRQQGKAPVQYKIEDDTNIKHIPLTRFLSHEKNKSRPDSLPCTSNNQLQRRLTPASYRISIRSNQKQ